MGPTTRSCGLSVLKVTSGYTATTVTPARLIYAGGGANELMTGTRKWNSGMVARGSIYVANDNKVYASRVPGGTPTPTPTPTATRNRDTYCDTTPRLQQLPTATATPPNCYKPTPSPTPSDTETDHAQCARLQRAGAADGGPLLNAATVEQHRRLP